jgi:flagellar biosynthesis protein FlhG
MRVIAVSSGKGGVGKTNLVVNLALALAERNLRVIILDGDLGMANVDIFFGITPRYSIKHLLTGEKRIEEILYSVERGIKVLSGGVRGYELANLEKGQLKTVLVNMGRLERMADIC